MSFSEASKIVGRLPLNVVDLELDACSRVYGESPCTASLALTNLCLRSTTFDSGTTWIETRCGQVANVADDPINGLTVVDRLYPGTANDTHYLSQTVTGLNVGQDTAWSIFVARDSDNSAGEYNFIRLEMRGFYGSVILAAATVDVRTGLLINKSPGVANSIDGYRVDKYLEGNRKFWRVTLSAQPELTDDVEMRIVFVDDDGVTESFAGGGVSGPGVLAFGSQLRQGANRFGPGKYVQTGATAVNNGGESTLLCYNTYGTCQDRDNYNKTTKLIRLVNEDAVGGSLGSVQTYPCITSVRYAPTQLQPGKGLSIRGSVTITCKDFTHNDVGIDPYEKDRGLDATNAGSFFGKLKARNEYYQGRKLYLYEGYINAPNVWSLLGGFKKRTYVIEEIAGPDANGMVTITAKDVLKLASDERAKCPVASTGVLNAAITAGASSLVVNGDATQYDVDKHIRIGDEILEITSRAGTTLNVNRGAGGTTAEAHELGDTIQSCKTWEAADPIDVIQELLEDFAGVDSSYIPYTDWQTEQTASLSDFSFDTIISEPTGVTKLLKEITETTLADLWYDPVDEEIKLTVVTPFTSPDTVLDDSANFIADSLKVKDEAAKRISRVLFYYGVRNFAENMTEATNYAVGFFQIEADREGVNEYDNEFTKVIYSRWLDSSNAVAVQVTAVRLLERFGKTPLSIEFKLDAKDDALETGSVFEANTRLIQDENGNARRALFQVLEKRTEKTASIVAYKALAYDIPPTIPDSDITISTNQVNYNLYAALGGPTEPLIGQRVIINAGVTISATQGNPAFDIGPLHPDSEIEIVNNGSIEGHAGVGGNAGALVTPARGETTTASQDVATARFDYNLVTILVDVGPPAVLGTGRFWFPTAAYNGLDGQQGGTAIESNIKKLTIENNGTIYGGGGGGGAGAVTYWLSNDPDGVNQLDWCLGAHGGSGGRGHDGTNTGGIGASGWIDRGEATTLAYFAAGKFTDGQDGNDGSTSAAGAAVAGDVIGGSPPDIVGTDSGAGGDWGEPGEAGAYTPPSPAPTNGGLRTNPGGGGAAGYAVNANGKTIVWTAGAPPSSDVKGLIG